MNPLNSNSYLGKYREVILAVGFFVIFDLCVLVLNFHISFEISKDALGINLAGRQRMLSQRMTKALLTAEADMLAGVPNADSLTEIRKTVELFDSTLTGFRKGASVIGGEEKPVFLSAITTPEGRAILAQADAIWKPYMALLTAVANGSASTPQQFRQADRYARDNNLKLLALMNSLTSELADTATAKANLLRKVQTGGILLSLLNFQFILFRFIRRLRANDRKVESARKETAEILETVKEGLFLLDSDFRIGSQYSASLPRVIGRQVETGSDFRAMLRDMVTAPVYGQVCDYIKLMFGDRVSEQMIRDLNPHAVIEVDEQDGGDLAKRRFLSIEFNRVMDGGRISHLLVTVFDITVQVELERQLAKARLTAEQRRKRRQAPPPPLAVSA